MTKVRIVSQMSYSDRQYTNKFAEVIQNSHTTVLRHPTTSKTSLVPYTVEEFKDGFIPDYCNKFKLELIYD